MSLPDSLRHALALPVIASPVGVNVEMVREGENGFLAADEADGPAEVSASDIGAPVLLVSQFTLYGDTRKGRRPSWQQAAILPRA